jgi:hypothetical protein
MRCLKRIWNGPKTGNQMLTFRPYQWHCSANVWLSTKIRQYVATATAVAREYCSHFTDVTNPLPGASVGDEQRSIISQESKILPKHPTKPLLKVRKRLKYWNERKGKVAIGRVASSRKKEKKTGSLKKNIRQGENWYEHPQANYFKNFVSCLCTIWRDIRGRAAPSAKAAWIGGVRIVLVGNTMEVCVTAAKFNAYILLH